MKGITLLAACLLLSACSFWRDEPPVEIVVAAPMPPPVPDTSFCQRIARQDAAPYFTPQTQRGIYERSYGQCASMAF